jgi:endo-1,4-beta-xylanase
VQELPPLNPPGVLLAAIMACGCGAEVDALSLDPPLWQLAGERGLRAGTFLFSAAGQPGEDNTPFLTALHQFDLWTVPVFFNFVEPMPHQFDFALPDAVVEAAPAATELFVSGMIYNSDRPDLLPRWLLEGQLSGAERKAVLVEYVDTVVRHFESKYPGRVREYEVVLEPLSWPGPPGPSGFWQTIGLEAGLDKDEYMRIAFSTARAAAPSARLYVDDFDVEGAVEKADRYYQLVSSLAQQGVAIDGVGLEGHFMIGDGGSFPPAPPAAELAANLERFASLGMETMVTSVDVSLREKDVSADALARQADAYRRVLQGCLAARGCRAFATWGVGDRDSWIPQAFEGWGSPLLFDAAYAPKPAYGALKREFTE